MNANDRKVKDSIENIRALLSEGMLHKINDDVLELTEIITAEDLEKPCNMQPKWTQDDIIRVMHQARHNIQKLLDRLDIILGADAVNATQNNLLTKQDFVVWVEKELRVIVNKMIHDKIIELVDEKQEQ